MKKLLIVSILYFFSIYANAQNSDSIKKSDSAHTQLFKKFQSTIAENERQRIADSLKKSSLEQQINSLKTTDNFQKEKLEKRLKELEDKETLRLTKKKAQIDSMRASVKSYPVIGFFDDTLFNVYCKNGGFSPEDRAIAINERIKKLEKNFRFSGDSLLIIPSEGSVDIMHGETTIASISENDAIWNNSSKEELAQQYKTIIAKSISTYRNETNIITIAKEIGLAVLVLLILGIILFFAGKFFNWTAAKIKSRKNKDLEGIKIKNYTLIDSNKQVSFFLLLNKIVKWLTIVTLAYIAIPILFGIFPWTKNFAETLFGYVLNPLKKIGSSIWNYLPNLFTIIVIFFVFRYTIKGLYFLKSEIEKGKLHLSGFYPDWANPTYQILKLLLYAFMFVLIFPYLPGSNSPIFQGVSVFLGFLFTFGSAGSLSNIIAGLVLTYMRLFKIGDRVKIGDVVGDVIEKSLLVTRVKTIKNEIISIPNSTVMSSHTLNYTNETENKGLIMYSTVTIGYDVPWKKMYEALLTAADRTNFLLKDPVPFVLQTSLDDFYVSYQINAYTKEANKQADIYSELHANIQDCCNEMGIEIMSPHYRAARDGNMTTIPESYLGKDYKAPSFNVNIKKEE